VLLDVSVVAFIAAGDAALEVGEVLGHQVNDEGRMLNAEWPSIYEWGDVEHASGILAFVSRN